MTQPASREPRSENCRTLRELEQAEPFQPHDHGCHCWPHVSQRAAVEAATQAAHAEYREGLRRASPSHGPDLREALNTAYAFGQINADPASLDTLFRSLSATPRTEASDLVPHDHARLGCHYPCDVVAGTMEPQR